jgi:hypothetical protein
MLRGPVLALVLALVLVLAPGAAVLLGPVEGVAWADDLLGQARKAIAESDYVSARPALATALAAGGHGSEDLAEIYRLTGIVDAALGDARAATEAFTRLLALSPRAALPAGTSPKIKRPFDAAAKFIEGHAALEVKSETAARPPVITLVVVNDPLSMIAQVRAVFAVDGGPEQTREVEASERSDLPLPLGRRIDARLIALDSHGNHLAEIGSREVPIVIVTDAPAPAVAAPAPVVHRRAQVVTASPRPVYLRWWPYAGAAAVFAGLTGYFAWTVHSDTGELDRLNADSVHHPFGAARAVEDRARREVLFTNIGLGVTGACALAAGILYLTTPRDRVETRVTAVPLPSGGAVVLGGTF